MKNYYTLLGLNINASNEDIKKAYRSLSKKYHPDINPKGAEQFKNINEANSVLSDPAKKREYDAKHKAYFGTTQNNESTKNSTQTSTKASTSGSKPKTGDENNPAKKNKGFANNFTNTKTSNTKSQSTIIVNGVKINVNGNNSYTNVTVVNGKVIIETK
jgi:curved DNA-binding protein CbpA